MSPSKTDLCVRCGASARTTPHVVGFDDFVQWSGSLCPRHYSQIIDFLELALSDWKRSTGSGELVVPVVTDLDLPVKKRGRPRKVPALVAAPPVKRGPGRPRREPELVVPKSRPSKVDLGEVRRWAVDNNVEVSKRGRVSADVIAAFLDAKKGDQVQPIGSRSMKSARNKGGNKMSPKTSGLFSAASN